MFYICLSGEEFPVPFPNYDRICTGCGNPFETPDARQTRCVKNCGRPHTESHRSRTAASLAHDVQFIGLDGEGVTLPDGRHEYVLLSVGDESLYHKDGSHLHWTEVFAFLYEQFTENPRASFVGFYLGYDFTQWLRSLPEDRARILMSKEGIRARKRKTSGGNPTPFPVNINHPAGAWQFDILGTKRFKLRPQVAKGETPLPWMYVCDTGAFWQTSFLKAIDPDGWRESPIVTPKDYATIMEGKANRATAQFDRKMIRYNVAENRALAELMSRLNRGFVAAGLYLSKDQWFGPGQVASAWLKLIGAPTGEEVRDAVPAEILDFARKTYYGGWFEIQAHGHIPGTVHEYDINSAYPAEIAALPCLLHGTWTSGTGVRPIDPYTMVRVHLRTNNRVTGVAPHRLDDGRILRPRETITWMWGGELEATARAGLIDHMDILEWHHYDPCDCPPPMASIASLYNRRLQVGKSTVEGKALKLVYNSAYGKFAQSVGTPRYSNAIYASLITAGCRTRILDAIASHPTGTRSLVMVATDGVYFRDEHPDLELDPNALGKWDHTTKENMTLLMPGVYWDDAARERIADGKAPQFKARGISATDLAHRIADLDDAFATFDGTEWPTLEMSVGFNMVSCKQALSRGKWSTAGHVVSGDLRRISSAPEHKRLPRSIALEGDVWRTRPWAHSPFGLESTPYDQSFGMEMEDWVTEAGVHPDAERADDPWWWAIHDA